MKVYKVVLSENAKNDIDDYIDFIYNEYKAPLTALRNYERLFDVLKDLSRIAGSIKYCTIKSITDAYGISCKRVNFKKMTIIFSVNNETVKIVAVLKQSLIKGIQI